MHASRCRHSGGRGGVRRTPSSSRRQQHINRYQLQLTYDSSNVTVSPFADIMINRLPTAPTNPSTTRLSIAQPAVNRLSATDSTTNHTSAYSTAPTTTTVAPTTSMSCPPPRPSMDVYDKWVWRRTIDDVCTSQRRSVPAGRRSMRTHLLQCECRWRRVRQPHQAMNHTLGTDSLGGEMRSWSRNSIGYKVCKYPPRLYHCSPCYDIDNWTVLSICVASLRLFPYHHTYTLRPLLSVL
jgi:hypothetical protein